MANIKVFYDTEQDREDAITANAGNTLTHDHIGESEKYLLFDDTPFDLSTSELKSILKEIVDQLNVLRTHSAIGLPAITYAQARDKIKQLLGF